MLLLCFLVSFLYSFIFDFIFKKSIWKHVLFYTFNYIYLIYYYFHYYYWNVFNAKCILVDPILIGWIVGYYMEDILIQFKKFGMMLHHITTLILIYISYSPIFFEYTIVTLLHFTFDDIFINIAKIYYQKKNKLINMIFLFLSIIFWFAFRVLRYGVIIFDIIKDIYNYHNSNILLSSYENVSINISGFLLFLIWSINVIYAFMLLRKFFDAKN